ncbi:MAG: MFS transporter [Actinomycetota bacterium]|nr:MFS transporter [Actinomycetota bacterium]
MIRNQPENGGAQNAPYGSTGFRVLGAISLSHFLNDIMQSLLLAVYPLLKGKFQLSFAQIGLITLCYQLTASLLQPLVGFYTDRHPKPYSLAFAMGCTMGGLLVLGSANSYGMLLFGAALVGTGSSIFHPESSRVARMASGGRHGLAQSIFQVGGNAGTAMGPLLAAWIVIPMGQGSIRWFSLAALLAIAVLLRVGGWYKRNWRIAKHGHANDGTREERPARNVALAMAILLALIFSKYFYLASFSSYYIFFLMHRFHLTVKSAQAHLFLFLFAVAAGTLLGGPIGDRIGRKGVIWGSILGAAPFALTLPYADLLWTGILSFIIGFILASAFSAIIVFAQELVPGKVGTVSGFFFGFAFGMGGIGAAVLGWLADLRGIDYVYHVCSFLPLLGILTAFLPTTGKKSGC